MTWFQKGSHHKQTGSGRENLFPGQPTAAAINFPGKITMFCTCAKVCPQKYFDLDACA